MLRRSDKTKSFGSAGDILATVEQQDGVVRAWLGRVQLGACTNLVSWHVCALALLRPTSHKTPSLLWCIAERVTGWPCVCLCLSDVTSQGSVLMVRFYEGEVAQDNKADGCGSPGDSGTQLRCLSVLTALPRLDLTESSWSGSALHLSLQRPHLDCLLDSFGRIRQQLPHRDRTPATPCTFEPADHSCRPRSAVLCCCQAVRHLFDPALPCPPVSTRH